MSATIINAPAPNLMARETEEFASVPDSSINETKSHASVAGLYDSGTGVDEYETQADDSETQADGNGTETDDNETQADEYEIEADENDTDQDDNGTKADEYETEAEENDTDADDNGTKTDEYVRYANKTLTQSTFRQIAGSRASKKTNDSPLDVELQKVDWEELGTGKQNSACPLPFVFANSENFSYNLVCTSGGSI